MQCGNLHKRGDSSSYTALVSYVTGRNPKRKSGCAGYSPMSTPMFYPSNFQLTQGKRHSKALSRECSGEAGPRTLKGIPVPSTGARTPTTLFSESFLPAHTPTIVKSDPGGSSKGIGHEVLHNHVCGNKDHHMSFLE